MVYSYNRILYDKKEWIIASLNYIDKFPKKWYWVKKKARHEKIYHRISIILGSKTDNIDLWSRSQNSGHLEEISWGPIGR